MTPCSVLKARNALHGRVDSLESGAGDYVTRPFAMSDLVARVRSLMHRPLVLAELVLSYADIVADLQKRALRCTTHAVRLPPAELQILVSLIQAAGRMVRHSASRLPPGCRATL